MYSEYLLKNPWKPVDPTAEGKASAWQRTVPELQAQAEDRAQPVQPIQPEQPQAPQVQPTVQQPEQQNAMKAAADLGLQSQNESGPENDDDFLKKAAKVVGTIYGGWAGAAAGMLGGK